MESSGFASRRTQIFDRSGAGSLQRRSALPHARLGILRQPVGGKQNQIGVMEYWRDGVMGKQRPSYCNTPSLQILLGGVGMTSQEFVNQLKKDIQAFPKIRIKHPFLKAVCNGTATMDQIRAWAIQDYQFRAAVPRIAMLRYLACSDPEIAQKLWGVVEEETRGMDTGSAGHNELAIRFAESIGLTKHQLENAELRPSTAAHLYYVELIIHTLPWFVVMAIQIGAEGTFGPAAAALGHGFIKRYNMKPDDVRFFTVHSEADEEHGSLAEEIAVRYITSPHLQEQTRKHTFRRMELLYDIWSIDGF